MFSFRPYPAYGGFASLVPPRWLLGVDVHLPLNVSRKPPWPHGTLRRGKMAEIRLESGIWAIRGPGFLFPIRRHPIYGSLALGVGPPSKARKPYTDRYSDSGAKRNENAKFHKYDKKAISPQKLKEKQANSNNWRGGMGAAFYKSHPTELRETTDGPAGFSRATNSHIAQQRRRIAL